MKKVARYYLGEEGIGNFDADHIQVRRRLVDNIFFLKIIPQEIVDMFSDAWYWVTMDEWTK